MVRSYSKVLVIVLLGVAGALSIARVALAAPSQTPEQIAEACMQEIIQLDSEGLAAMFSERVDFQSRVAQLPSNTPISQLFKMATPVSVRLDKIGSTTAARIDKAMNRCAARIARLDGDQSLIKELAAQSQGLISELDVFLRGYQYDVVNTIDAFILAQ